MSTTDTTGFHTPEPIKPDDLYNRTSTGLGTAPTWLVPRRRAGTEAETTGLIPGPPGPAGVQGPAGAPGYPVTSGHEGDVLTVVSGVPVWADSGVVVGVEWEDVL